MQLAKMIEYIYDNTIHNQKSMIINKSAFRRRYMALYIEFNIHLSSGEDKMDHIPHFIFYV